MRLEALLCDAATVREGLLHVLGAGITRIRKPFFPGTMDIQLAMVVTVMPVESDGPHKLKVVIQTEDGVRIAEIDGEFRVSPGDESSKGEPIAMPLILNLRQIALPKEGTYSVEVLIDSQLAKSMPFKAVVISSK